MQHKSFKRYLILATAVMLLLTSACSTTNNGASGNKGKQENTANTGDSKGAANSTDKPAEGVPLGKYEPAIEVTTVRSLPPSIKFEKGDSIDNNIWYRSYEEELGIKLINKWSVPQTQWQQK